MALSIKWTKRASHSFHKIVEYIEMEWDGNSAKKFVIKVSRFLESLKSNPEIGKVEVEDKGIRGYVLSKQTTILYRIKEDKIILLNFFDNKQHPKKKSIY